MSSQISYKANRSRIKKKLSFFEGGHQLEKLEFALAIAQTKGDDKKSIKNKFNILIAGGQDHLKGKIFRVGHLVYVNDRDIITIISAISKTLVDLGKITTREVGEALIVASRYLKQD